MNTNRRTLLGAGAALALPSWIARAFDEDSSPQTAAESAPKATLVEAEQRARAIGKPLLVIFTDPECAPGDAGRIWGEFFMHATDDAWLDLALVEVACLPRAAAGANSSPASGATRWAMLIETDGKGSEPRFIDSSLPAVADRDARGSDPERSKQVRARAATLAARVREAILPDGAALQRRAAQSATSAPDQMMDEEQGRLEAALVADSTARLVDLDRFAACVRHTGSKQGGERLALAARLRLFEHDLAGARWGTVSDYCPPCGMGYTPPESRYFLRFYAE